MYKFCSSGLELMRNVVFMHNQSRSWISGGRICDCLLHSTLNRRLLSSHDPIIGSLLPINQKQPCLFPHSNPHTALRSNWLYLVWCILVYTMTTPRHHLHLESSCNPWKECSTFKILIQNKKGKYITAPLSTPFQF